MRGRCAIHHVGFLLLDFEYTEVRFAARWANPFWEALQLDIDTQYDQIYSLVDNFSSAVVLGTPGFASSGAYGSSLVLERDGFQGFLSTYGDLLGGRVHDSYLLHFHSSKLIAAAREGLSH